MKQNSEIIEAIKKDIIYQPLDFKKKLEMENIVLDTKILEFYSLFDTRILDIY